MSNTMDATCGAGYAYPGTLLKGLRSNPVFGWVCVVQTSVFYDVVS